MGATVMSGLGAKPAAAAPVAGRGMVRKVVRKGGGPDDDVACLPYGRIWPMTERDWVAYTTDRARAAAILGRPERDLARRAMAVYYDAKGRPFAWQVRFETRKVKAVRALLTAADAP